MSMIPRWLTAGMLLCGLAGPVQALTPQQKLEYIQAVAQGAGELLGKGRQEQARLALLSVLAPLQSLLPAASQQPVKQLFEAYMQSRNGAWPDAPAALSAEALQGFLQAYQGQRTELARLARLFDPEPNHYPKGAQAYYRHVADILAQRQHAYRLAGALSRQAPPPDQLVTNQQVYMELFKRDIPKVLYHITFGPVIAAQHAQQRVIPENLTIAREALQRAAAGKRSGDVRLHLHEAREALRLVEGMEAAMRGEVDWSHLLAELPMLRKQAAAQGERVARLYEKEVDDNRMPKARSWNAGEAEGDAVLAEARQVYEGLFPNHRILAQNLQSQAFGERWESWWENDSLLSAYHAYVLVATAAKTPEGQVIVRLQRYRRTRTADGGWTALSAYDTLENYPMREANL